jgi:predicted dienelactone hydrolase
MKTEPLVWHKWPNVPRPEDFPIVVVSPGMGPYRALRDSLLLAQEFRDNGAHWSRWRIIDQPSVFVSRDPLQRNP